MADQDDAKKTDGGHDGSGETPKNGGKPDGGKQGGGDDGGKSDDADKDQKPKKSLLQRPLLLVGLIAGAAVLIIGGVLYWLHARQYETTDDAYVDGHIVRLAPQVSGNLDKLLVDDNAVVAPGQLLAIINTAGPQAQAAQLRAQAGQARAAVAADEAQIKADEQAVQVARSNLRDPQANVDKAAADLARYERLARIEPAAIAGQQLDQYRANLRVYTGRRDAQLDQIRQAEANLNTARTQVGSARAQVQAADAAVAQQAVSLGDAKIVSPIYGTVANRNVEIGSYVTPGQQIMAIVPRTLWITANFKETQLARMRVGQPVELTVDAMPSTVFHGHVDSFQRGAGQAFRAAAGRKRDRQLRQGGAARAGADHRRFAVAARITRSAPACRCHRASRSAERRWRAAGTTRGRRRATATRGRSWRSSRSPPSWRCSTRRSPTSAWTISRAALAVSLDESTWVLTSYLVSNAIIIPISGWLSQVIGRKRYYMLSVALFTGASLMCGLAPNLTFLIIARVLQGIGGGGLAPSEQSMLADTFPPEKRGQAFGAYAFVIIVAPVLGPTIGGWVTDNYSWHWIFLVNVPVGLVSLFLVNLMVTEPKVLIDERKARAKRGFRVDFLGFLFVVGSLGCLEVVLDRGQREDWFSSAYILTFGIISALSFIGLVVRELTTDEPIVRLQLLGNRNFAAAMAVMTATGFILFGSTQLIPQMLQTVFGYTATNAGFALTAGGIGTVLMVPFAANMTGKVDVRLLLGFALFVEIAALWHLSTLSPNASFESVSWARFYQALGLPFLFVPITAAAYSDLKPGDSDQASALLNVFRNLGGTFGIAYTQTLLARRQQFNQSRLVERLNPLHGDYATGMDQITQALRGAGQSVGQAAQDNMGQLYQIVLRQANMLSYIDVYWKMTMIVLLISPVVLLLKGGRGARGGAA